MTRSRPNSCWPATVTSIGILVSIIVFNATQLRSPVDSQAYFAAVKTKIRAIPYQLGYWNGVDRAVTEPAIRLLKPNELFKRTYTNRETGEWFSLQIVHCMNTRDMEGHYPPVCYKAHGWKALTTESLTLDDQQAKAIPASLYHFESPGGRDSTMMIVGFFVIPSGKQPFSNTMDALSIASRASMSAEMGAAQVQIITDGFMPADRRDEITELVLGEIRPVLQLIAKGSVDER